MSTTGAVADEDDWLYGENTNDLSEQQRKDEINAIVDRAKEDVAPIENNISEENNIIAENGDAPPGTLPNNLVGVDDPTVAPENDDKDSDDEDDSDDDVQVVIGDIKPVSSSGYPSYSGSSVNINIKRGGAYPGGGTGPGSKPKGIDVEAQGQINGIPMFDFNLDTIEDKPWRKPGADITDYFNYGFNEDSWKIYCDKQRKLRGDNNTTIMPKAITGKDNIIPIATVNENSKYAGALLLGKKAGPPPGRRMSGSIDVICGNTRRGAKENVIQVIGGNYDTGLPPGMPPTHIPPPFIPPNLSVPPPGMAIAPSTIQTIPPLTNPMYPGNPMYVPPPPINFEPSVAYDENFFTGAHTFEVNSESQHSWTNSPHRDRRERSRERSRGRDRERDRSREKDREHYYDDRSRDRDRPEDDYKRRERDEEHERRRYKDYRDRRDRHERDYDRERDYERYDRDYERGRDSRERDRERRRDRDDHRERDDHRDDKYRERSSRRRHHHSPSEEEHYSSSRHKHKKSRKDKDETPDADNDEDSTQKKRMKEEGDHEESREETETAE